MNKSVLFVCYGNICRSPMAEYIFKYITNNKYKVSSRATSLEEIGNDMYYKAKKKLKEKNIPFDNHVAKKITKEDYDSYDLIVCFDSKNYQDLKNMFKNDYKIRKIKDKDVEDPWYTRNFEKVFNEIYEGCINIKTELESF